MQREFDASVPERMDIAAAPTHELLEDLQNLEFLNRWFGGVALVESLVANWWKSGEPFQIVDLACGYADVSRHLVLLARKQRVHVQITAIDLNAATLALAKQASADFPEIEFREGNLLHCQIPASAHLILCTLALHHFPRTDAVQILRRLMAARTPYVLVTDLWRNRWLQFGVWLLTATVLRAPMTRHDARISVRRAFSKSELIAMAREAGWENFGWKHHSFTRQAIWLEPGPHAARSRTP